MKSAFDQYVSAAVRKERMAQGVSQATLAYGIGVSDGFISQVESPRHRAKYNLNHLNEIARFLGCSPPRFSCPKNRSDVAYDAAPDPSCRHRGTRGPHPAGRRTPCRRTTAAETPHGLRLLRRGPSLRHPPLAFLRRHGLHAAGTAEMGYGTVPQQDPDARPP